MLKNENHGLDYDSPTTFVLSLKIQILYGTLDNFMETLKIIFKYRVYLISCEEFTSKLIIDDADDICLKTLKDFSINLVVWIMVSFLLLSLSFTEFYMKNKTM